jgi:RNA polymerase sigma-70 factor (ECF subfamily)
MAIGKDDFIDIIEVNQNLIWQICRIYKKNKEDREDLFQEIVYRLWKSVDSFRGESKFSTWIYRVALNTALSSCRKKTFTLFQSDISQTGKNLIAEQESDDLEEDISNLYKAIDMLNEMDKALIFLYLEENVYSGQTDPSFRLIDPPPECLHPEGQPLNKIQ